MSKPSRARRVMGFIFIHRAAREEEQSMSDNNELDQWEKEQYENDCQETQEETGNCIKRLLFKLRN